MSPARLPNDDELRIPRYIKREKTRKRVDSPPEPPEEPHHEPEPAPSGNVPRPPTEDKK